MFQIPSIALRIKPRVWVRLWGNTLFPFAAHGPLTTRSQKKKKTHSLTLLLQNHRSWICGTGTFPICSAVLSPRPKYCARPPLLSPEPQHWHIRDLLPDLQPDDCEKRAPAPCKSSDTCNHKDVTAASGPTK